jgi:hypothetical protein
MRASVRSESRASSGRFSTGGLLDASRLSMATHSPGRRRSDTSGPSGIVERQATPSRRSSSVAAAARPRADSTAAAASPQQPRLPCSQEGAEGEATRPTNAKGANQTSVCAIL